ncbi:hypothetical protein HAX54_045238 [Datura stramonium]|uniref:Uncharacterized protein n=1 Tax=Datura stramonium TaxID=4076 RepID=A0ABS8RH54_DATST|nr:hypothetical protein [Datura stramonium]
MGKSTVILIASVVCLLSLVGISEGSIGSKNHILTIEGRVYCDPCRSAFQSKLSEPLAGARVQLQCHRLKTKKVTFISAAMTNSIGYYRILLEGQHRNESCVVNLVSSPREDCNVHPGNDVNPSKAVISLSDRQFTDGEVYAPTPLRFLTNKPSPECVQD